MQPLISPHLRLEFHLGGLKWVVSWKLRRQVKDSSFIRRSIVLGGGEAELPGVHIWDCDLEFQFFWGSSDFLF
jgi:hypothetical protein